MKIKLMMFAVCGFACAGCVMAPFIDESIAKADANPLFSKFDAPPITMKPITPLSADFLVGVWLSIYTEYMRWMDGLPENSINSRSTPCIDGWKFIEDGRYTKSHSRTFVAPHTPNIYTVSTTEYGRWAYQEGVLTLNREGVESSTKQGDTQISQKTEENHATRRFLVEWYADNDIILKDEESLDMNSYPPGSGYRVSVSFNDSGVKTTRMIHVTGTRGGRETGELIEFAASVRFKKSEPNK